MATRAPRKDPAPASRPRDPADARTRRYAPAETRTRVLEAAYMLFGSRGYAATGTADIAREADVSEGSIFYHFGSKRALLVELGRLHGEKMIAAMQRDDPLGDVGFEISINRCFDFCEVNNVWDEPDGVECTSGAAVRKSSPEAEPFFHAAREVVEDWTRRHVAEIARRSGRTDIDIEIAPALIFALVGDALHRYFRPGLTDADRLRIRSEVVRFLKAAIA